MSSVTPLVEGQSGGQAAQPNRPPPAYSGISRYARVTTSERQTACVCSSILDFDQAEFEKYFGTLCRQVGSRDLSDVGTARMTPAPPVRPASHRHSARL